jgi:hypothetical protein
MLLFTSTYDASVMLCAERHQFCNPDQKNKTKERCTSLTGRKALQWELYNFADSRFEFSARQWATIGRLLDALQDSTLSGIILKLGATTLRAQNLIYRMNSKNGFRSLALPADQWKEEVLNWHDIAMNSFQRWIHLFASGPIYPDDRQYIQRPTTLEELQMCSNQRFRPGNAMSFDGLAIVLILSLGLCVIAINLALPSTTGYLQRRFKKGVRRQKQWILDETLQLQRMAFEGGSQGTWHGKNGSIPVTKRGEKLFGFPLMMVMDSKTYGSYIPLDEATQWDMDNNPRE